MTTQQIKFRPVGEEAFFGGILVNNEYVICGCCGGVYEPDDIEEFERLPWTDISEAIKGE
jgi:hypothetical protein